MGKQLLNYYYYNYLFHSDEPITFYERMRCSEKLVSSGFSGGGTIYAVGSSYGDIFVYTIRGELGLPTKDEILEGHKAMVISICFAKHSIRYYFIFIFYFIILY